MELGVEFELDKSFHLAPRLMDFFALLWEIYAIKI